MAHEITQLINEDLDMLSFIRKHWGEMLGPHISLLDEPGGLEKLQAMLNAGDIAPHPPAQSQSETL